MYNKIFKKLKIKNFFLILFFALVIVLSLVLLIFLPYKKDNNTGVDNFNKLETEMLTLVDTYYNSIIKEKIVNVSKYIITIDSLEKTGYNIDNFKNCKKETTYAEVIIENPNETNKDLIKHSIDVYLDCKNQNDKK